MTRAREERKDVGFRSCREIMEQAPLTNQNPCNSVHSNIVITTSGLLYGSTPNGSWRCDGGVWLDGGLCTTAIGGVNAVDALGNGANEGTSAENPLCGEEKFDRV